VGARQPGDHQRAGSAPAAEREIETAEIAQGERLSGAPLMLTRLLGNLLYQVSPRDPIAFGAALLNENLNVKIIPMAGTYVPLISSGVAGPLGVLHLPRLWQKVSLEENGRLASGYPGVGKGFDAMTLAALGLEEQAVRDYIKQNKPTYPEFEAWVKKNAKSLNRDAIEKHNAAVRGYDHDDETRRAILSACGMTDDASAPKDAVNLNNLDDWYEFHRAVLA
jgi:Domain of unknown function (DUF5069)